MAKTRLGLLGVGVEDYAGFTPKGIVERTDEQFTRLTLAGIGGAKYAGFVDKEGAGRQRITRLTLCAIGGARYAGFVAKAPAEVVDEPEQEEPTSSGGAALERTPARVVRRPQPLSKDIERPAEADVTPRAESGATRQPNPYETRVSGPGDATTSREGVSNPLAAAVEALRIAVGADPRPEPDLSPQFTGPAPPPAAPSVAVQAREPSVAIDAALLALADPGASVGNRGAIAHTPQPDWVAHDNDFLMLAG
jgi:hypothetical protein